MSETGGTPRGRVVDAPLASPAPRDGLLEVFRRRYLLRLLIRREISARYQGSLLGLLWSYINPLTTFFIYWFVIGKIMGLHTDVPNFGIHLFCGLIVVHFFTETFNAGTRSIVANQAVVKKMSMPREMFPVASMLVSLYHVVPQLVILVVACLLYGWVPDVTGVVALAVAMLVIMLIGTAAALLFSAFNVYLRDFGKIVGVLTNLVRFSVPMIYPFSMVDQRFGDFADYYLLNPLADAVLLVQRAFWVGTVPSDQRDMAAVQLPEHLIERGLLFILVGVVLLVIAQKVFTRMDHGIPERLQ